MKQAHSDHVDDIQRLKDKQKGAPVHRLATGLFLVLLGSIFLFLQWGNGFPGGKSWLVFLLIPVFWVLVSAWQQYEEDGRRFTPGVLRRLTWGIFPFAFVAFGSLVGWQFAWPLVLIAFGVSALLFAGRHE